MPTPKLELIMQAVLAVAQGVTGAQTVGRYMPTHQSLAPAARPAIFVIRLDEWQYQFGRHNSQEQEVWELQIGVVLCPPTTDPAAKDAALIAMEAAVSAALTGNDLGGLCSNMYRVDTRTPVVNQSIPVGTSMPRYQCVYAHDRGNPFGPS